MTGAQVQMRKGGIAAIDKGELIALLRPSELAAIAGAQSGGLMSDPVPDPDTVTAEGAATILSVLATDESGAGAG